MKLIILAMSVFINSVSFAEILSEQTVLLPVDLSSAKIKLSQSGYIQPTVKILIPELAKVTIMNHRNPGESAPCLATFETEKVEDVVKGNPTIELVPFTIKLEKSVQKTQRRKLFDIGDESTGSTNPLICKVTMSETVSGVVRGFKFTHLRTAPQPDRVVEDCK